MGKFKRIKDIFNKVKKLVKDVGSKVIKPAIKFISKHAPGLMKVLVKLIKSADKVGARRIIINLIPEAGPYVNQAVDYLIKAQEKGVIDEGCRLLDKVIDGKINIEGFIEEIKKLIGDVARIEVEGMPNPLKIVDQVVNSGGTDEEKRVLPKIKPRQGITLGRIKPNGGERETLKKEALTRENEEYEDDNSRADDIFGPSVNK